MHQIGPWRSPWASKVYKPISITHGVHHKVMAFAMNLERPKIIIFTPFPFKPLSFQLPPTRIHSFSTPTHNYYLIFPKPFKTFKLQNFPSSNLHSIIPI